MSILNKLHEITIDNTNRIFEKDSEFCVNQYYLYVPARDALQKALDIIKAEYEKEESSVNNTNSFRYLDKYDDIKHLEKRLEQTKNNFIFQIVFHFSRKYNVSFNPNIIIEKYDINLTHNDIIGEIYEQLDGCSFEEKAVQELIETTKNTIYDFNNNVSIKKSSVSINNYVWWYTWSGFCLKSGLTDLYRALSHFENGSTKTLESLNQMLEQLRKGDREYDIFSKYEFDDFETIESIKVFKNSKITIQFKTHALAQEFANTYLRK